MPSPQQSQGSDSDYDELARGIRAILHDYATDNELVQVSPPRSVMETTIRPRRRRKAKKEVNEESLLAKFMKIIIFSFIAVLCVLLQQWGDR
jgi:hypothetical protein